MSLIVGLGSEVKKQKWLVAFNNSRYETFFFCLSYNISTPTTDQTYQITNNFFETILRTQVFFITYLPVEVRSDEHTRDRRNSSRNCKIPCLNSRFWCFHGTIDLFEQILSSSARPKKKVSFLRRGDVRFTVTRYGGHVDKNCTYSENFRQ